MGKNYVDDKDLERKDEKEIMENYEKRRTGYYDDGSPLTNDHEQQLPGDEIVDDLRELSRQDENPVTYNGENVQQEPGKPRYGDSISETADKEYRKEEVKSPSEWQTEKNYQNSGQSRNSN
jgi:hypothetical protein